MIAPPFYGYPYDYYYGYPPPPAYPPAPYMDANGYWYWCPAYGAYYPYVQDCPGGWALVQPQY